MEDVSSLALKNLLTAACDFGGRCALFGVRPEQKAKSLERAEAALKNAALAYFEQVVKTGKTE